MKRYSKFYRRISITLLSIAIWESAALIVRTAGFPHSWSVVSDIFALFTSGLFWTDFAVTIWISISGLIIGSLIALFLGIVIGLNRNIEISSRGTVNFIRVIPSVVLLPLLIASIGSSRKTAVILTAFVVACTFITYVIRGIGDTDLQLIESTKLIKLSPMRQVIYLYLPSTVTLLGTGIRLSANRAFGTVVAAGIVAGTPGLGSRLYLAQASSQINRVFAYVFIMGMTGVFIYSIFTWLENRLFKWKVSV
jgi:ABC-type nitrate/sulfonate/bicarbonate transport system permease component